MTYEDAVEFFERYGNIKGGKGSEHQKPTEGNISSMVIYARKHILFSNRVLDYEREKITKKIDEAEKIIREKWNM